MKISSFCTHIIGGILLAILAGGCATLSSDEKDGVAGAKIGGVEGVLPSPKNTQNNSYGK